MPRDLGSQKPHDERAHRDDHDRHADDHPSGKRHVDAGGRAQQADADQVRRRADRCAHAADRRRERRDEHHRHRIALKFAIAFSFASELGQHGQTERKHHRGRRRIAHPHRQEAGDAGVRHDEPQPARADPCRRERGERQPAIEAVGDHPFGEDEAADEEKNDGIGERRVCDLSGGDAEDDAERRPEQRGNSERQRLRHPEDDHQREHRAYALRGRRQARRHEQNREREQRAGDQAECLASPIEGFFAGRVCLGRHAADIMEQERARNNYARRRVFWYTIPDLPQSGSQHELEVIHVVDVHRSRRRRRVAGDFSVCDARVQLDGHGRVPRRLAAEAPLVAPQHPRRAERLDDVEHVRPHIRQRRFDRRHPVQDLRAHERLAAPASAARVGVLKERLQSIDGVGEPRFRRRMRLELVPQLPEPLVLIGWE